MRTALITGGGSGIGLAIAEKFVATGITTVIDACHSSRSPQHTDAALEALDSSGIRALHMVGAAMDKQASAAHLPQDLVRLAVDWNAAGAEYLPGHLGFTFLKVETQEVVAKVTARKALGAWNGYLHAGAVVTLADTCCGYGTARSLPDGASGFTTIELKSNFFGSAREGTIVCVARPLHQGRTTQVWDAIVTPEGAAKPIAQFRCTQMVLWPKG